MMISFAWTTPALLAGKKTVTRRDWSDDYARRFRPGLIVDAYDQSPRRGGRKIGTIRIVSVRKEPLQVLLDDPAYAQQEMRLEGDLWPDVESFIGLLNPDFDPSKELYRIEFEVLSINP